MNTMTIPESKPIETRTKYGKPVWNMVKPTQYMMSENEKTRKSLFLNVAARDLKTFSLDGFGSIKSVSFKRIVGSKSPTNAIAARTMKQIR